MNETSEKLRHFIVVNFLFNNQLELGEEMSFLENSIIDSTGMLELVTFIEQEFGIAIDYSELVPDNLDSIKNIAAFVTRKRNKAQGLAQETT